MPENSAASLFQDQKKTRPKIEDVISSYLSGAVQQNAAAFAAYCRENKLTPQWTSSNTWVLSYKGKRAGYIKLRDDSWYIIPYNAMGPWPVFSEEWEQFIRGEGLTEIVWENIKSCQHCLPCAPGRDFTILGKAFTHVCNAMYVFWNPDARTMDGVKKLIEFRKGLIAAGKA